MPTEDIKSVDYAGFGDHPELRPYADRAMQLLSGEINSWRDRVSIVWEAHLQSPNVAAIKLELSLDLPNATGTATRFLPLALFDDDEEVRSQCRRVWGHVLDQVIEQQVRQIKEWANEPAGV
jgi:hypothetical protein